MFRQLLLVILLAAVLWPNATLATMVYLDPPVEILQRGDTVLLAVRLDVDTSVTECVNAADVVITYPPEIEAIDTSVGNSIFPFWVERPTIDQERGQVTFAGGIPNGYCGRIAGDPRLTNVLTEIVFRAPPDLADEMVVDIAFGAQTTLYLNDGLGTAITPETFGATLTLLPTQGAVIEDRWLALVQEDTTPPEPFSIYLERDPAIFGGDYFIVFNTTDKQTGLAGYEVMEEPLSEFNLFRFGAAEAPWRPATSPYRLRDQTLNSTIRVRATDKAGNEYVATLIPDPSLRTSSGWPSGVWFVLVVGFVGVLVLTAVLLRRRPAEQSTTTDESS